MIERNSTIYADRFNEKCYHYQNREVDSSIQLYNEE